MTTVSQSFTAAGNGAVFLLRPGASATYVVSGTFTGFVDLRRSRDGGMTWALVAAGAADTGYSGSVVNESPGDERFRFQARDTNAETAMTGTAVAVLADPTPATVGYSGAVVIGGDATIGGNAVADSLKDTANVGTAATGVTAVEYGDGYNHTTILTVATTLPAIAGGAALGLGKLLYTLPAGAQMIEAASMSLAVTHSEANIAANTPKVGLGTTIASGVVSALDGTAAFNNLIAQQDAADCDGTATVKAALPGSGTLVTEASDAKTVYANFAATWAASGDAAAALTGTVVLKWSTLA